MPKRSSKPRDLNQLAHTITQLSTTDQPPDEAEEEKDPAAVRLGRKGGLKGGKARAAKMSADERQRAARKAARARWSSGQSE